MDVTQSAPRHKLKYTNEIRKMNTLTNAEKQPGQAMRIIADALDEIDLLRSELQEVVVQLDYAAARLGGAATWCPQRSRSQGNIRASFERSVKQIRNTVARFAQPDPDSNLGQQ